MWFLSRSFGMAWLISLICFFEKILADGVSFISKSDLDLSLLSKKLWQQSTLLHYCKTSPYPEIFKKKHIMRNSKGALKKIFNSIMSFECKYKTRNYQFSSAKLEEKQTIYFLSHGHKSQQLSFCWPKS